MEEVIETDEIWYIMGYFTAVILPVFNGYVDIFTLSVVFVWFRCFVFDKNGLKEGTGEFRGMIAVTLARKILICLQISTQNL